MCGGGGGAQTLAATPAPAPPAPTAAPPLQAADPVKPEGGLDASAPGFRGTEPGIRRSVRRKPVGPTTAPVSGGSGIGSGGGGGIKM